MSVARTLTIDGVTYDIQTKGPTRMVMNRVTASDTVTIPITETLCKIVNPTVTPTTAPANNITISGTPVEGQLLIISNMSDWDAQGSGIYVPSKECQQFVWMLDSEDTGSWISISYGRIILS